MVVIFLLSGYILERKKDDKSMSHFTQDPVILQRWLMFYKRNRLEDIQKGTTSFFNWHLHRAGI